MATTKELKDFATQVRRDIVRMVHDVQSGHPGGSLDATEFMTVLYNDIMDYSTNFKMEDPGEDLFFLSNGHISPVWYSVLARTGFFPIKELATFRKLDSRLQGHPTTHDGLPGIRMSAGSLGQGLSVAIGTCEAKKLNKDNHLVYTLHGDGELQEGQIWEAVMYAAGKNIDNLISTIDYNQAQIDGMLDEVLPMGDLNAKFSAFGWKVLEIKNGNDINAVREGLLKAKKETGKGKPVCIIMHTIMGHGVDFMMDKNKWHGKPPNDEQLQKALEQNPETLGDY